MHYVRRHLEKQVFDVYLNLVDLSRLFEMDSRKKSRDAFPPNSVVRQLFGKQDNRLPSIFPIEPRTSEIDVSPAPQPQPLLTRHAVDPVLRLHKYHPNPNPIVCRKLTDHLKIKSIRSRSQPNPKCTKWKDELPKDDPSKLPKKQPNISVASHIVRPRLQPKCRWEVKPKQKRSKADIPKSPEKATPEPGYPSDSEMAIITQTSVVKSDSTGFCLDTQPSKNIETVLPSMKPKLSGPILSTAASRGESYSCRDQDCNESIIRNPEFFGTHCRSSEVNQNLRDISDIIPAKEDQKTIVAADASSAELRSRILSQYEDLKNTLSYYQSLKDDPVVARKSTSILNVSKLVHQHPDLNPDLDEVKSSVTSDFRMNRNVAWLKEQREFLPILLAPERQDYGDAFLDKRNTGVELPHVLPVNASQHRKSLLNQEHFKSLDDMMSQGQRSRSPCLGTLQPAMRSRSRSVPSPVFRFPFQKDQTSSSCPKFGPERETKYLRIALAARQSFLKELRHRVHKAHAIFKRHHQESGNSGSTGTEVQELLNSHQSFVKWLYNYVLKGTQDINKFDELNIFVNAERELNYYFETQYIHNGISYAGIFVPVPFNKHLISEARTDKPIPVSLRRNVSIGCQYEDLTIPEYSQSLSREMEPKPVAAIDEWTQTRSEIKYPSQTHEREVQTDQTLTSEQQNQTSQISLRQENLQGEDRICKNRSIFQMKNPEPYRRTPTVNRFWEKSTPPPTQSSRLPPLENNTETTSEYKLSDDDEFSICTSVVEEPINHYVQKYSSASRLDESLKLLDKDVEAILFPDRKSLSLQCRSRIEERTEEFPKYEPSKDMFDEIPETTNIISPSTHSLLSASSIESATSTKPSMPIPEEAISKEQTFPQIKEQVPVQASVTEENIRKKIESITEMIRQFRSDSFESANYEGRVDQAKVETPQTPQVSVYHFQPIRSSIVQNNLAVEADLKHTRSIKPAIDPPPPKESSTEFYSFTNIPSSSRAQTFPFPSITPDESGVSHKPELGKSSGTIGAVAPSDNAVKSKIQTVKEQSSSKTVYYDFQPDEPPPVNILFRRSFKKLNAGNVHTTNSENSCFEDGEIGVELAKDCGIEVQVSPPQLTRESESFLRTHLKQLRSELLTQNSLEKCDEKPVSLQYVQIPLTTAPAYTDQAKHANLNRSTRTLFSNTPNAKLSSHLNTPVPELDAVKTSSSKQLEASSGSNTTIPMLLNLKKSTAPVKAESNDPIGSIASLVQAPCVISNTASIEKQEQPHFLHAAAIEPLSIIARDTTELHDPIAPTNTSKCPAKSKIPILQKSPKPVLPSALDAFKTNQGKRFNAGDKTGLSRSFPCSPRSRIVRPSLFSPREASRLPVLKKLQLVEPSTINNSVSPRNRIADKDAIQIPGSNCNRFGFSQGFTNTQEQAFTNSMFGSGNRQKTSIPRPPKPFSPRNRNLEESCSPSPTSPGLFLNNLKIPCNYTTEYGASFNRFSKRNYENKKTGKPNTVRPEACQVVMSKTLAANFNCKC